MRRLRALSPGEAMEQNIRQAEKMSRNIERASRAAKVCLYNPCQWIVHIPLKICFLYELCVVFSFEEFKLFSYVTG